MKNDERIVLEVKVAKSIGYTIFWFGIFAVLLYRWFVLNQSLMDTLDFFAIWFIASLAHFFALAIKGIPITYPISMDKKEQLYFLFLVPLATGVLTVISVFLRVGMDYKRLIGGFLVSFVSTLLLFLLYKMMIYVWEKRNT